MGRPKKNTEIKDDDLKENVSRPEAKQNPGEMAADTKKNRKPGKWIDATPDKVAEYEEAGKLQGYDQKAGQVLLKEGK